MNIRIAKLLSVFVGSSLIVSALACTAVKGDDKKMKDLEDRVAKAEGALKDIQPYIEFLKPIRANMEAQQKQQEDSEPDPNARFAIDVAGSPADGSPDAYVTIVEGFDFACPYCEMVSPALDDVVKEYPGKVRVVYKNFVVHPDAATTGHLGSCAAFKQGKYVDFKRAWWPTAFDKYKETHDKGAMGEEAVFKIATDLKLDMTKFKSDMKSPECTAWLQTDQTELAKFGVRGTPALFINGKMLPGAVPKEQLKSLIDGELKIAEASGVAGKDYYQKEIFEKGEKKFKSKGKAAQ